jgi:hypothetical protein
MRATFWAAAVLIGLPATERAVAELLWADFNDKPIDRPIGTGGAAVGEPVHVDPWVTAIVRAYPFPTPSLETQDNDDHTAGAVRFEFLGSAEITSGIVTITTALWFDTFEDYNLYVREQGTSPRSFLSMHFTPTGAIVANDDDSSLGTIGSYELHQGPKRDLLRAGPGGAHRPRPAAGPGLTLRPSPC